MAQFGSASDWQSEGQGFESPRVHKPADRTLSSRKLSEKAISRLGAAAGVASVIVTFVGFGVHGALPTDTTAEAVQNYVRGVSASQAGIGNYLELLGYLLFLGFATYLYVVARAGGPKSMHWLNVLSLAAAITYSAMSAFAIAGQVVMVDWLKAGVDAKSALGAYILDSAGFTLSFEVAALFLLAVGIVLWTMGRAMRLVGGSGMLVARRAVRDRPDQHCLDPELEQPDRLHGVQRLDPDRRNLPARPSSSDRSNRLILQAPAIVVAANLRRRAGRIADKWSSILIAAFNVAP